ncbi:MAG: UPF0149 family protein [Caulobacter sp.]
MSDLPPRLKVLDKMLRDLALSRDVDDDCMMLTEFDGFIAGILVCPDLIMPSDWLPMVWGGEAEDAPPAFDDIEKVKALIGLVLEHYNATIGDLGAGRYAPLFDYSPRHDETLWEIWMGGFERAMGLRPDSWTAFTDGDEVGGAAMGGLVLLVDIANGESLLPKTEVDRLTDEAPDLITEWVDTLYLRRPAPTLTTSFATPVRKGGKVGRNDPCLCGSGRKYKMCCGRN